MKNEICLSFVMFLAWAHFSHAFQQNASSCVKHSCFSIDNLETNTASANVLTVNVLSANSINNHNVSQVIAQLSGRFSSCKEVHEHSFDDGFYLFPSSSLGKADGEWKYCFQGFERFFSWDSTHGCGEGESLVLMNNVTVCRHPISKATYHPFAIGSINPNFTRIMGKVSAYGYRSLDAFCSVTSDATVESFYVDGISLTAGAPGSRRHLFTLAGAAHFENSYSCPCSGGYQPPLVVGDAYYCDVTARAPDLEPYVKDYVIWSKDLCGSTYAECCTDDARPYFFVDLPADFDHAQEPLELRSMISTAPTLTAMDENIYLFSVEFFGQ
eukprot:GCRY01000969.1.p1 GENE.GCRY01000969.1~~GCRY01000969.1.p1  ORF type:complete len:327 (+),score=34.86 GCRY01000969.1:65-1045(+)